MSATRVAVPYQVAARELLRESLLDAARNELERRPWGEITMSDIATAAGVSRQTLYNEFGSRGDFAQALVLREEDRLLDAVEAAIGAHLDDPAGAFTAALDVFLAIATKDPVFRSIASGEGSQDLLPLLTTGGKPVVERAAERLAGVISRHWPQIEIDDVRLPVEFVVRLGISYVTLPPSDGGLTGSSVVTVIEPYVQRLLDEAGRRG
jgi:AcrR family transcriptional regulator